MTNHSRAAAARRSYDVFLSYRGEDTRKSFVSHLYGALVRRGVYTFKDDEKFEKGRPIAELIQALQESRISIVVLSPNFADSSWCLDELVRILECKDVQGQQVLPIFYNVDPSHVRRLQGSFGEAFSKLHANLSARLDQSPVNPNVERLQKWTNALEEVSNLSGYCTKDREEFLIVEQVVKVVLAKLHEETPNNTENLIGLTSRLEHLDLLLGVGSDDVRFVGIWGMGGIGKTTIARAAYEKHFNKFEGHYFLPNVRESYRGNDPTLQEKILRGVLRDRNLSLDFSRGNSRDIMKERLCQKRVLIVLDDVDRTDQLENLVGRHDWFGPGSRIVIATREKHLLVLHQVDEIYKAEFLDNIEAMKLFCHHAFKANYHDEAYTALSKQMVEYANGLPLALRVWGSFLYSKSVKVWESELKKLQKIPKLDIFNILKVSYDGLDDTQKDILLDIACFFKGGTRDYVRDIMDSCGFSGESGIEVLIDKCLITIVDNRIWMHDLVQEMSWEIVRQQSRNPSKRTRLWSYDDVCHALQSNEEDKQVEGIFLDLADPREMKFSVEAISRMKKLRVLRVGYLLHYRSLDYAGGEEELSSNLDISEYVHQRLLCEWRSWEMEEVDIAGCNGSFTSELICLHWDNYHMISLPSNFHPKNITELSLCNSRIRQLWVGVKNFEKLKYVNLSWSFNLTSTPDFSGAPNLERLILDSCVHLQELHPSVAFLRRLIVLNLNFCQRLLYLPNKLHLVSLQNLGLYRCSSFKVFPEIIEPMEHVTELNLFNSRIEELPSSIELLHGLRSLNLSSCKRLRRLPGTICKLKSLEYLTVSGCSLLKSFPEIEEEMPKLRELLLDGTPIKELPASLDRLIGLEWLNLDNCWNLTCIPDEIFLQLKSIKYLHVEGCFKLDDRSLENLQKVRAERKFVNRHHVFLKKSFQRRRYSTQFVSHLYAALDRRGIYTFKDDEKFKKGSPISEIIQAINESKISVVVLSQNFANSSWCLDELVRILECKDVNRHEVLPVFYHVDPSHVRKQQGSFGEAFAELQSNLLARTLEESSIHVQRVQKWRKALEVVSGISGYDTRDREEHAIVEKIVKKVNDKLHEETPRETENLIGVDSRMDHLGLLLNIGADDVCFVGIWGLGGVGKTAIARVAYQRHLKKFDGHYFLPNVRESYRRENPTPLQNELLCGVFGDGNFRINSSREGRFAIKERLCRKRVLIVLDDVDNYNQIEDLVGGHDWFGPGSRIIVTTRDQQILVSHGGYKIYTAEMLNKRESMELFCQFAFKNKHLSEAYTMLAEHMVEYSGGLPLALRVLGSFLCSKSVKVWESELLKLHKRKTSNLAIFNVLKASYYGLDDTQKDIFLDIACFFKGVAVDYVRDIMDGCGFSGESGIEVLFDRSLITISENRIWMHDLVQEMGWEIIRQKSNHPSLRTRLWLHDDICCAIESSKDKEELEGISFNLAEQEELKSKISVEAISRMKNLRVLRIGYFPQCRSLNYLTCEYFKGLSGCLMNPGEAEEVSITSCKESLPSKLVSLHWDGCSITSLTDNFCTPNLVDLSIRFSWITQLLAGVKHLDKLKYVNLSHSRFLVNIPDLSGAPYLESLILSGCVLLQELHSSVAFLKRLIVLKLNGCVGLVSLPNKLHLVSLQDFDLWGCSSLTAFPEIAEPMPCLEELDLSNSKVKELPPSIEYLSGLRKLNLESCKYLRELPRTICKLKNLEVLILIGCSNLDGFPEIEDDMPKLIELSLRKTPIRRLPRSFDRLLGLEFLDLDFCMNLTYIPDAVFSLKSLKYLHYVGCCMLCRLKSQRASRLLDFQRKWKPPKDTEERKAIVLAYLLEPTTGADLESGDGVLGVRIPQGVRVRIPRGANLHS